MQKTKKLKHENITISRFLALTVLLGFGFFLTLPQILPRGNSDSDFSLVIELDRVMDPSIISKTDPYTVPRAAAPSDFMSRWNTSLTSDGSSNADQIRLPLESSGTYDFIVDWGDGASNHIVSANYSNAVHTYASKGEYTLNISGTLTGWRLNDGGDVWKLLDIGKIDTGMRKDDLK